MMKGGVQRRQQRPHADIHLGHGICDDCMAKRFPDVAE